MVDAIPGSGVKNTVREGVHTFCPFAQIRNFEWIQSKYKDTDHTDTRFIRSFVFSMTLYDRKRVGLARAG